jgi:DNA-directed RNA polymerase I, II, and III subunit RPABC1
MNETQLCQSFAVVLDMLEARGVDVTSVRETYSLDELSQTYLCNSPSYVTISTDNRQYKIFYFNHSQYKKHIKTFNFEEEDSSMVYHIVILTEKLNHTITKSNSIYKEHKIKFQMFHINEVLINISKHHLVPKHEILTKKEEQSIVSQYMLTKIHLPWILKTDPMAKFLGLEAGQIVKITHPSPTNGEYISYRTCV